MKYDFEKQTGKKRKNRIKHGTYLKKLTFW